MMAEEGTAIMLVEQHTEVALSLARDAVVIERGTIALRAPSSALLADRTSLDRLIGLNLTAGEYRE
jgi:branched-chain amino acid transport system ATP-binding protein